jgi:xanthine dehydrogenase YagS FAD-binding subunit
MATALLVYDARVDTTVRKALPIEQLLGDGSNGAADNALGPAEMILVVELPFPLAGERAAYRRGIGRAYAEWPLAEVVARVVVANRAIPNGARRGRGDRARAASPIGGRERFARRLRLPLTIATAARAATAGANPLPMPAASSISWKD